MNFLLYLMHFWTSGCQNQRDFFKQCSQNDPASFFAKAIFSSQRKPSWSTLTSCYIWAGCSFDLPTTPKLLALQSVLHSWSSFFLLESYVFPFLVSTSFFVCSRCSFFVRFKNSTWFINILCCAQNPNMPLFFLRAWLVFCMTIEF